MKHRPSYAFGFVTAALLALVASSAGADTTANGPYYANPSWDQQLPAATRFVVLANWATALFICLSKNVGGRGGWKLPNIQELRSIVDPSVLNPALPPGHPFTNVQGSSYWSA